MNANTASQISPPLSFTPNPFPEFAFPGIYTNFALKKHGAPANKADIHTVLMIGALYSLATPTPTTLSDPDDRYAAQAIEYAAHNGIKISNNVRFSMINCNYGRDFLTTQTQGDMAIFCHIAYDPKGALRRTVADSRLIKQSPLCEQDGIWHQKSLEAGLNYLFNITSNDHPLPTSFLARKPYRFIEKRNISFERQLDFIAKL